MVLGGLALVLSRLIDNSVVVLENIFRHLEEGEDAAHGGREGRPGSSAWPCWPPPSPPRSYSSRWSFSPASANICSPRLALGVVLALAASYLVAMTVVPLFCSRFIKSAHGSEAEGEHEGGWLERALAPFNRGYDYVLRKYDEARRESARAVRR